MPYRYSEPFVADLEKVIETMELTQKSIENRSLIASLLGQASAAVDASNVKDDVDGKANHFSNRSKKEYEIRIDRINSMNEMVASEVAIWFASDSEVAAALAGPE